MVDRRPPNEIALGETGAPFDWGGDASRDDERPNAMTPGAGAPPLERCNGVGAGDGDGELTNNGGGAAGAADGRA